MPTRHRDLRARWRMTRMTATGIRLLLAGIAPTPPKALRRQHKEK